MGLLSDVLGTGRERWRTRLTDSDNGLTEVTVVDDTAHVATGIAGYDSAVFAVDTVEGEMRWRYGGDLDYRTPTVVGGTVYVTGADRGDGGAVLALDAATGGVRWRHAVDLHFVAPPTVVDDTVYVVGRHGADDGGLVLAVDAATGDPRWERRFGDVQGVYQGVVVDGTVLAPLMTHAVTAPRLVSLDADTGRTRWELPSDSDASTHARGPVVVADGVVFVPHGEGLSAVSADRGDVRWTHGVDGGCAWPTVHDGTVFATTHEGHGGDGGHLVALDADSGRGQWRHEYGDDDVTLGATVADGRLYVGRSDGGVFALDATTGDRQWQFDDADAGSGVTVADGSAYFTTDTHLVALSTDGDGSGADAAVYHQTRGHHDWSVATASPPGWLDTTLSGATGDTQVYDPDADSASGDTQVYDPDADSASGDTQVYDPDADSASGDTQVYDPDDGE